MIYNKKAGLSGLFSLVLCTGEPVFFLTGADCSQKTISRDSCISIVNLNLYKMAKAKNEEESGITAYSVKTKTKNVPMIDPVINIKNGRYIAVGRDSEGNNMSAIMGKDKAEEHVKAGRAQKGEGWK